jgi:quercetin dioxygenase-like cupin family protein
MDANFAAPASFIREPGAGSTVEVPGVTHTYKATGAETARAFSLWEAVVAPGTGAPPHTRTREEAFYVLSGELLIELEGEPAPRRVGPGGFFYGAAGATPFAIAAMRRPVS